MKKGEKTRTKPLDIPRLLQEKRNSGIVSIRCALAGRDFFLFRDFISTKNGLAAARRSKAQPVGR